MFSSQRTAFTFTCPNPSVFLDFYFFSLIQIKHNSSSINNKIPLAKNYFCRALSLVQLFSRVWLFATLRTAALQASLFIINSWSLLKLMSIKSVLPSHHLILCRPLLLLPSIFPCIRVFSNESALHIMWPKYWSFSFSISSSSEYSGLISYRMDWLDLLSVQGTLKRLLQHHSSTE